MPTSSGDRPRIRPATWLAVGSGIGFVCGLGYVLSRPYDAMEFADAQIFLPLASAMLGGMIGFVTGLLRAMNSRRG